MYQHFTKLSETEKTPQRFKALRNHLDEMRLDGFVVPRSDEFQNEYVPANAERLRWLTGFSGSAGLAVVLRNKAAIFVDGRYVLQVGNEIDPELLKPLQIPQNDPADWLAQAAVLGARIGFDPRLHSIGQIKRWREVLAKSDTAPELVAVDENPLDKAWIDRPDPPTTPARLHPKKYAGQAAPEKIAQLQAGLKNENLDAFVLTNPSSICWLFNIRGGDVPHTPLVLSYAIIPADGRPELILAPEKLQDAKTRRTLEQLADLQPMRELEKRLKSLKKQGGRIGLDPSSASSWFADRLAGRSSELVHRDDPCTLPKAIKNAAEIRGMRNAHRRDGVAVSRFLCWLDKMSGQGLDEIEAAKRLEQFRLETGELLDLSFETISGAGANGAIVHYRVDESSKKKLRLGSLYLVDSGGQYRDGTTDITRTVAIGQPSDEMRRHYTLVLKGHIALASARFPKGTRGVDLDVLARGALWKAGLDYDHGTGHGVGAYLGVHEGPQNISRRGMVALQPGMIVSNEPGFYKTGRYGIRIENLVLVGKPRKPKGGERPMLDFETLTLAPLDRRLIDTSLLDGPEIEWIDGYHSRVVDELLDRLPTQEEKSWLRNAATPLT